MCPWMELQHIGSYVFAGNLPMIAQLPNASHGGVIDKPVAKMQGSGAQPKVKQNPLMVQPPAPPTEAPPLPEFNKEQLASRAERRRAEAEERRRKRKEAKKNKKK